MANIDKLNYSFVNNQTTISAEHLNAFVDRINKLIDAVGEQPTPTPTVNKVYFDIHDWVDDGFINTAGNATTKVPESGTSIVTILPLSVPSGITSIKVTRPIIESDAADMAIGIYNGGQNAGSLVESYACAKTASAKGTYEVVTIQLPSSTYDRIRIPFWKDKKAEFECYYETTDSVEPQTPVSVAPAITIEGTSLTLSAQQGATIYYTLDGTTPTTSSNQYSSAVTLTGDCTIKAIAVESGKSNSPVSSRTYSA